jgi:hypothetical protein
VGLVKLVAVGTGTLKALQDVSAMSKTQKAIALLIVFMLSLKLFLMFWNETPNETVEKPKFCRSAPVRRSNFHRGQGWNGVNRLKLGLDQSPEDVDLADIVDQSEQCPLYIHFTFGS